MNKQRIITDFAEHLKSSGYTPLSIKATVSTAAQFLKHVGTQRIDRISEADARSFFDRLKHAGTRKTNAARVNVFLHFAMRGLPAVIDARGAESPRAPTKKELALKAKWSLDKLITEKEKTDDLVALLARKMIDHYMYFEGRMKGEPENLDTIARFADECRELIQANLPLFMQMSAAGRNVHTRIDERVQT